MKDNLKNKNLENKFVKVLMDEVETLNLQIEKMSNIILTFEERLNFIEGKCQTVENINYDELISHKNLAKMFNVCTETVHNWRRKGLIKPLPKKKPQCRNYYNLNNTLINLKNNGIHS